MCVLNHITSEGEAEGVRENAALLRVMRCVQVIALICYCMEARGDRGPYLIAAPASVLQNWAAEFARWAPSVKVGGQWTHECQTHQLCMPCAACVPVSLCPLV